MGKFSDALRFTIEAGVITAVFEYDDGLWEPQSLDEDEVYSVDPLDANVVVKTETKGGVAEIDRYRTSDGGLTYFKIDSDDDSGDDDSGDDDSGDDDSGDDDSGDDDLYRFTFGVANAVVAAEKFDDGVWKPLRLDDNEFFSVDPVLGRAKVIQTEVDDGETKTDVYVDTDGNGVYIEVDSVDNSNDDVYYGSGLADNKKGGSGNDDLYGDDGDDELRGEDGDDDLYGDDASDDLHGGTGSDELYGGKGSDDLNGDSDDDHLSGGEGKDDLSGDEGNDELEGDAGRDKLTGGRGLDRLSGGLGADKYRYVSKSDSAVGSLRDVIVDFKASQNDRINLVAVDASDSGAGNQRFSWLGSNPFSGVAGQLRFEKLVSPGGILIQADTNGDRKADFEIFLAGINTLTSDQIML